MENQRADFHAGRMTDGWRFFGAHPAVKRGKQGWGFRVWAPHARSVRVLGRFNDWDKASPAMARRTARSRRSKEINSRTHQSI